MMIPLIHGHLNLLCLGILPLAILLLSVLIGRLFRHAKRGTLVGLALALLFIGGFLYGRYIGFNQFTVRYVEIAFSDLPPAFDGYRIVQFSDAHVGSYAGDQQNILQQAVDSINAQEADLVVFIGDLQNIEPSELEPHAKLLSTIHAKDGVLSVLGNHDYAMYVPDADLTVEYTNLERMREIQEDMGWHLLMNGRVFVCRGQDSIVVAGMENDGEGRFPAKGDLQRALWGVSRQQFVVMLEHDPTSWRRKILPHSHAQLTLSGHVHGGQFTFFGWSVASLRYREYSGLYRSGSRALYVTNGLGGLLPVRIGTPGEIVVITLRKE